MSCGGSAWSSTSSCSAQSHGSSATNDSGSSHGETPYLLDHLVHPRKQGPGICSGLSSFLVSGCRFYRGRAGGAGGSACCTSASIAAMSVCPQVAQCVRSRSTRWSVSSTSYSPLSPCACSGVARSPARWLMLGNQAEGDSQEPRSIGAGLCP